MTDDTRPETAETTSPTPTSSTPQDPGPPASPSTSAASPKAEPAPASPEAEVEARASAEPDGDEAQLDAQAEGEDEASEPLPATFDELGVPGPILSALAEMGWTAPTPVQSRCYGPLTNGADVLVQSHTGSGKTGAFCLPWLAKHFDASDPAETGVQLLVVLPTRELAKQVCVELDRLAGKTGLVALPVYGGTPMVPQLEAIKRGVHAVVGTPGRILDHIRRRSLDLSKVQQVVLDECDEMLSMGFLEDIHQILQACPKSRQTCLFSATVPRDIQRISERYMRDPQWITLSTDQISAAEIDHAYYVSNSPIKTRDLVDVVMVEQPGFSIVFCNTREETRFVAGALQKEGYEALDLSSDLSQSRRERVLQKMRDHKLHFLVATDIAARGIDISHVSHVFNYSFPEQAENYVHRTGRTGRAGRPGVAISLVSAAEIGNFNLLMKIYKSLDFVERKLPPKDELAAQRLETKLDKVSQKYSQLVSPEWTLLARQLIADPRGEAVLAALLSEAQSQSRARARVNDDAEDESESGYEGSGRRDRSGRGERRGRRDRGRGDRDERRSRRDSRRDESSRDDDRHSEATETEGRKRRRTRRAKGREKEAVNETPAGATEVADHHDPRVPTPTVVDMESAPSALEIIAEQEAKAKAESKPDAQSDAKRDAMSLLDESSSEGSGEGKADSALALLDEGEGEGRKRRRRRRRKSKSNEGEGEATTEQDDASSDGEGDEAKADGESQDDEDAAPKKKRRRRRRRKKKSGDDGQADGQSSDEGASTEGDADDGGGQEKADGEGKKKRRRRRRRGRGRGESGEDRDQDSKWVEGGEQPAERIKQEDIVIDIDDDEMEVVREQFGDVDALSDLTLKSRRRDVLDDLRSEVVLEDLSELDTEEVDEDDDDDDSSTTPEGDDASDASDDADKKSGDEADAKSDDDDAAPKKKRRRRRRRKKKDPPPPPPELTAPPHKDFWEVWSGKFSIVDFAEAGAADDAAVQAEEEREREASRIEREASAQDAVFVTVELNIGRSHGRKASDIRGLLQKRAGLKGRAVRDLTVRAESTVFRVAEPRVEPLTGSFAGFELDERLLAIKVLDPQAAPLRAAPLVVETPAPAQLDDDDDGGPADDEAPTTSSDDEDVAPGEEE